MKKFTNLFIIFAAASLLSCGSSEEETPQLIECGEGTVEENGACVPSGSCPTGQFAAPDGRCVRADYCAEGTHLDQSRGTCVADPTMRCGPETVEEDGECIPEFVTTCGAGTVAADGRCRPYEDFCGPGTSEGDQSTCRPSAEVCGEGTIYDVQLRQCVRESALSCGAGTTAQDGQCLPISAFYEELRQAPDLDKSEPDAPESIELKEDGEPFAFIGTITSDTAQGSDTPRASEDIYRFQGRAGQILRIGVYSLGLPDPGFQVVGGDNSYKRLSDLGAGIETSRMLVLPEDGEYELTVSSIIQLSERGGAMGGDDWDYVGYVQIIDSPPARNVSITDATLSGDIRREQDNFYRIVDAQRDERFPLFLVSLPTTAGVEFVIWEKNSGLVARNRPGDDQILILPAPAEEFYLFVDYEFASNINVDYNARVSTEGIRTESVGVAADQFLRVSQSNRERRDLNISVDLDGTNLGEQALADRSTTAPGKYFHHFTADGGTAYVTGHTDTGEPLGNFDISLEVIDADRLTEVKGEPRSWSYDDALEAQQVHYLLIESVYDDLLSLTIEEDADVALTLYDAAGVEIGSDLLNALVFSAAPQTYLLAVEALEDLPDGFELLIDTATIFPVSQTSSPGATIVDNTPSGVSDTIRIQSCPSVADIDMDINITHGWRGDLHVRLTDPAGTTRTLFARAGGSTNNLIGNFNETIAPETGVSASTTAEPIANFIGTSGAGDWVLTVSDDAAGIDGVFNSWTLNLICEG